ncbi:hypothetical protein MASR2M15_08110 [Anaerolineales bacterium]
MVAVIRLYLDENLSPKIAVQLRRRGVDIVTVHELGLTGDTDENHLQLSTKLERSLVTADTDFLIMAAEGVQHAVLFLVFKRTLVWVIG